ncbi:cob(I)yrinic acid a,c-diamide adenosyltransferase [Polymorphobacter fuscus]|uniref:Corrinoid adenosyltransferase n=1 Tax=Sandarakinorhabdus fusca TaxID=1439888 RepID=A0A7C9KHW2_9SPHN|nr:cob(I)yrinic acid a,c-diamide adenosyltransferase [Polymorphobacter fuscus]KAB7647539.1 cob(I)yrinic acid a,c-diamide adenosyltransferase [Polymorphobacter fuscus]MQT16801.1 cob(I)yrinic acid a,c-diamide adenosyltransferase [Polymorphobacter fuscus]NJC09210.1 cob(I)alamin adenosyltransferase [Polymorphobacter fuscus]
MVKLNRIYTRTGDDGTTGLVDGSRRSKADPRLQVVGAVDETNAAIGMARLHASPATARALGRVQNDLFDLGADLATPDGIEGALRIVPAQVEWLEAQIDAANDSLSPLKSFILPAGTPAAASLHLARTICRRAERDGVAANAAGEALGRIAMQYLNRLSDYLFVLSRVENSATGDVLWVPGANR